MNRLDLSLIIPAYNEASRLPETLARIRSFLDDRRLSAELILVADGSTDDTVAITTEAAKAAPFPVSIRSHPVNRGKGYCVADGVRLAAGRRFLVSDADLSTPLEDLDRLAPWLDCGYSVAIGSRMLPGEGVLVQRSWKRAMMGWAFNQLAANLVIPGFHDTQCGFKLLEAEAARHIFSRLTVERFAFDVEMLVIAGVLGYPVVEVPVSWREDPRSKVRPVHDACAMTKDLFRIRRQMRSGRYGWGGQK